MKEPAELVTQARAGSRTALARLISYVESGGPTQRATASLAYRAPSPYVVGITGAPGSGKSTLTDRLIAAVLEAGSFNGADPFDQVAVLCVDPSSPFSGGAILGDRIRMQDHATNEHVFIRSMATRGHLGGLSLAVPDAVRVLGAATFALALVETVGVGQLEVEIASAADTTVVVVNPGWGDAMQANKAGLLEVADIFVINKADRAGLAETRRDLEQMLDLGGHHEWRPKVLETVGVGQMEVEIASAVDTTVVVVTPGWGDSMQASKAGLLEVADVFVINKADRPGAREARRDLEQMLDLARPEAWRPEIVDTTATSGEGVADLWGAVARHRRHLLTTSQLVARRSHRLAQELRGVLLARTEARIDELVAGEEFTTAVKALVAGELDPYQAADRLLGA